MKKVGRGRALFACVICFCGVLAMGVVIYAKNNSIASEMPLTDEETSSLEVEGVDTMAECVYFEWDNDRNMNQIAVEVPIDENDVPTSSVWGTDSN